jgi:hypothetical protein
MLQYPCIGHTPPACTGLIKASRTYLTGHAKKGQNTKEKGKKGMIKTKYR